MIGSRNSFPMASRCWGVRRSNGAIGPVCRGGWRGTMAHRWHVSSSSRSVRSMVETIVGSRNHNRSMTTQPFGAIWPFNERRKHREHRHPNHHHHQQQLIERQQIERQPHSVLGVVHSDLLGANVYNRLQIQCNAATAATNRRCSSSSKRETVTNPEETSKSSTQRTMEMKDDTPVGVAESLIHKETHTNQNHRTQPIVEASSSDPPVWTWIDRFLPPPVQPYARLARLDKPIGTMLLLWPCYWSTAVAAGPGGLADPWLLVLFGVGAVAMRGAGCTVNDAWDQDLDRRVARTAQRPLAARHLTNIQAALFALAQTTVGLAVLVSLPNMMYCLQWGCASLPLVIAYPLMKRFFPYPQLILGLTINWGAIMGWAAVHGTVDWTVVAPLYGSGVTWTLVYDTLYAHQDKVDDAKLGLQSTALTFGTSDTHQRRILYVLAMLTWLQWLAVGNAADLACVPYYSLGATLAYSHLLWQVHTADFNDPHNLAHRFRSNSTTGAILFGALTAGSYFA